MTFNRFSSALFIRLILLCFTSIGLSLALTYSGYYALSILLAIVALSIFFELNHYITKTNKQLANFLTASIHQDFHSNQSDAKPLGAGFKDLAESMNRVRQTFEQNRTEQAEELRHLQYMTEHIPVPLMSIFANGTIHLHNNAARQLFSLQSVHKLNDLNCYGLSFCESLASLQPGQQKLVSMSYDGMEKQLTAIASQIEIGGEVELLVSLQDIQSELDNMQLQAWEELVSVLTHEIMNSITPVASLAETTSDLVDDLQSKVAQSEKYSELKDDVEDIVGGIKTVARRSDSLMQFVQKYRSMSFLPKPDKQVIKVQELFERITPLFQSEWKTKNIALNISIESDALSINADPELVEQILINLLKNSQQAMRPAGAESHGVASDKAESGKVDLSARINKQGKLVIEVSDNGPGISDEMTSKIFVPFYTTKAEGSGVGLALTRQVMLAHGGSVVLDKSADGGARFRLMF